MHLERDAAGPAEAFESFPEVLLPAQVDPGSRFGLALGERRLLWAMLLDAATCFHKHRLARDNNGRKLFREAERWIRSRDERSPFSFQAACDVLGLNAQHVRVSLLQCVYGHLYEPAWVADEARSVGERGPRQQRHAAGSRCPGTDTSRIRSHRSPLGERVDPLARAFSSGS